MEIKLAKYYLELEHFQNTYYKYEGRRNEIKGGIPYKSYNQQNEIEGGILLPKLLRM